MKPECVIDFRPPGGCQDYCTVTVWATSPEMYERIRALALHHDEFVDHYYVDVGSGPTSVCHWREGETYCSLHALSGYARPIERPRQSGAF